MPEPTVIVMMGVAGVGKTAVGQALAARLGWRFADADDFHPPANVAKMQRGEGLTDADRAPWLAELRGFVEQHLLDDASLVLACSALKVHYRNVLCVDAERVRFVWLDAPPSVLAQRLQDRSGHYAGAALLPSQLATLEPPPEEAAIRVEAVGTVLQVVEEVEAALGSGVR